MSRSLHTQFCDDIRQEVGNKLSLMGVYNGALVVPSMPFELPRLFVSMRATASNDEPFKSLSFVVMVNDTVITQLEIPQADLSAPAHEIPEFPGASDLQRQRNFQTFFALPPLSFEAESIIRSRLITESGEIRGDSLMILAPRNTAP